MFWMKMAVVSFTLMNRVFHFIVTAVGISTWKLVSSWYLICFSFVLNVLTIIAIFPPISWKGIQLTTQGRSWETNITDKAQSFKNTRNWDPSKRNQNDPRSVRVSLKIPEVRFIEILMVDELTLIGKKVLHVVDERTRCFAALFFGNESLGAVWTALLKCWVSKYSGLLNRILVAPGTNLGSLLVHTAYIGGPSVEHIRIEFRSRLEIWGRYHHSLQKTHQKIFAVHPTAYPLLALAISIKDLNDRIGSLGHISSAFVFGNSTLPHTI